MKDFTHEEAPARIGRLETELERAKAELERARAAQPDRAAAHLRRLEGDNAQLREERRRLEEEVAELRRTFRHEIRRRTTPVGLIERAVGALVDLFFGRREGGGGD